MYISVEAELRHSEVQDLLLCSQHRRDTQEGSTKNGEVSDAAI